MPTTIPTPVAVPIVKYSAVRSFQTEHELEHFSQETREPFQIIESVRLNTTDAKAKRGTLAQILGPDSLPQWDNLIKEVERALIGLPLTLDLEANQRQV